MAKIGSYTSPTVPARRDLRLANLISEQIGYSSRHKSWPFLKIISLSRSCNVQPASCLNVRLKADRRSVQRLVYELNPATQALVWYWSSHLCCDTVREVTAHPQVACCLTLERGRKRYLNTHKVYGKTGQLQSVISKFRRKAVKH